MTDGFIHITTTTIIATTKTTTSNLIANVRHARLDKCAVITTWKYLKLISVSASRICKRYYAAAYGSVQRKRLKRCMKSRR
jgi:hypothetical protein